MRRPNAWQRGLAVLLLALVAGAPLRAAWGASGVASTQGDVPVKAISAVLMDAATGQVLFAKNGHERRNPASITKLMTLLLVFKALDQGRIKLDDMVTGSENAYRMGGSQIWMEVGEQFTVRDMITAVAVGSANDASVALAEHVAGSVPAFVDLMNKEAAALGLKDTHFANPHGLDATDHYSSAYDLAILSRYIAEHEPAILKYTSIYSAPIRQAPRPVVILYNTNKMLKRYPGVDGLKTGWTSQVGYGVAVTATRDGTRLISVVLGEPNPNDRWSDSTALLDYGFARYRTVTLVKAGQAVGQVAVEEGRQLQVPAVASRAVAYTVAKGDENTLTQRMTLVDHVKAPVRKGQKLGEVTVLLRGQPVRTVALVAGRDVEEIPFLQLLWRMLWRTWPLLPPAR